MAAITVLLTLVAGVWVYPHYNYPFSDCHFQYWGMWWPIDCQILAEEEAQ
jgi:hypothetical protein